MKKFQFAEFVKVFKEELEKLPKDKVKTLYYKDEAGREHIKMMAYQTTPTNQRIITIGYTEAMYRKASRYVQIYYGSRATTYGAPDSAIAKRIIGILQECGVDTEKQLAKSIRFIQQEGRRLNQK